MADWAAKRTRVVFGRGIVDDYGVGSQAGRSMVLGRIFRLAPLDWIEWVSELQFFLSG